MDPKDRIIVALDVPDVSSALLIIEQTHEFVGCYKIGLELIAAQEAGRVASWVKKAKRKVFLDIKLHDIPTTVVKAIRSAKEIGADIINLHAAVGLKAMQEAVQEAGNDMMVAAVTVLTSLDADDLTRIGFDLSGNYTDDDAVGSIVVGLASLAYKAGIPGLICSAKDLKYLKHADLINKFKTITPGVRPTWAAANDQKRIMTPTDAILAGSDYLVVGRPITNPPEGMIRADAARQVLDEVTQASSGLAPCPVNSLMR
jgi:orotidine-5'-phosphate decarboxylase